MPAKSKQQLKFMYAVRSGKVPGVSKEVGADFVRDTPRETRSEMMKGKKRYMSKRGKKR